MLPVLGRCRADSLRENEDVGDDFYKKEEKVHGGRCIELQSVLFFFVLSFVDNDYIAVGQEVELLTVVCNLNQKFSHD